MQQCIVDLFHGVLRARATSQPLATLRAVLTLPIHLFLRGSPQLRLYHIPCHFRLQYFFQTFLKFLYVSKPPLPAPLSVPGGQANKARRTAVPCGKTYYREAPIFFMRPMTISPILAISSAVKAWRKFSENRTWALGGNSSSPNHSRKRMVRPLMRVIS